MHLCQEFVKQQIALVSEDFPEKKTLIHGNAPKFTSMDHSWYNIKRSKHLYPSPKHECLV